MKRPCGCNTCPCYADNVLTWTNDRDFAPARDLSDLATYPDVDPRVWTDQPRNTQRLWRIVMVGSGYLGGRPINDGTVLRLGPMADSTMYGWESPALLSLQASAVKANWSWEGETPWPGVDNTFRLEVGCVSCNCFCVNEARIHWPDEEPRELNYHERTAIHWNGDSIETITQSCPASVGFIYQGMIKLDGGPYMPWTPEKVSDAILKTGRKPFDLGTLYVGVPPSFYLRVDAAEVDLSALDIIFYEHRWFGNDTHPFSTESGRYLFSGVEEINALKQWLYEGNRTLVLSSGLATGLIDHIDDYEPTYSDAEAAFGVEMYSRFTREHDGAALSQAEPQPHVLTAGCNAYTVRGPGDVDNRSDGLTSGTPLWSARMNFTSGPEWVPMVVVHDVGNGSRLIVGGAGNLTEGMSLQHIVAAAGFMHVQNTDRFIQNVINEHGNY